MLWSVIISSIFIIGALFTFILYTSTKFEKKITIKEKYMRGYRRQGDYFIVDTDNNVYRLADLWFIGEFDRGDDYAKIEDGKTYVIKGYGKRIPVISMFPRVYDIALET